jgi:hypothetical protein
MKLAMQKWMVMVLAKPSIAIHWNGGKTMRKLPHIGSTGKNVSCNPSNSAPSESVFSVASRLISKLRANLDPELASMVFYLSENHKWFKKEMESTVVIE